MGDLGGRSAGRCWLAVLKQVQTGKNHPVEMPLERSEEVSVEIKLLDGDLFLHSILPHHDDLK